MTRKPTGNYECKGIGWAKHLRPFGKRQSRKKAHNDGREGIRHLLRGDWYRASSHMSL